MADMPARGLHAELDRLMANLRQGSFGIGGLLLILIALVAAFSLFEPTTFPRATTLQAMMFQIPELGLLSLAMAIPLIEAQGITLVGVTLGNLTDRAIQLALPVERRPAGALDATIDDVRERFGADSITRAVLLGRDAGIAVPLLPD